jgi:hypothetical protein
MLLSSILPSSAVGSSMSQFTVDFWYLSMAVPCEIAVVSKYLYRFIGSGSIAMAVRPFPSY